jgi:hypothetical protein
MNESSIVLVFWLVGTFDADIRTITLSVGILMAFESLGSTISNGLGAARISSYDEPYCFIRSICLLCTANIDGGVDGAGIAEGAGVAPELQRSRQIGHTSLLRLVGYYSCSPRLPDSRPGCESPETHPNRTSLASVPGSITLSWCGLNFEQILPLLAHRGSKVSSSVGGGSEGGDRVGERASIYLLPR